MALFAGNVLLHRDFNHCATLKLSNFDETGGIIAAHTTSIPEAPSSGRTLSRSWEDRYWRG